MSRAERRVLVLKGAAVAIPFALLFVALRALLPAAAVRQELHALGDRYQPFQVGRVRLFTTAGEEHGHALVSDLDRFLDAFARSYGELLGIEATSDEITVIVFENKEDEVRYGQFQLGDDLEHALGFYRAQNRLIGLVQKDGRDADRTTILHEGVHLALNLGGVTSEGLSPWLDEGLASAFEASRVDESGALVRRPSDRMLGFFATGRSFELRPLIEARREFYDPAAMPDSYAAAEAVVTWLLDADAGVRRDLLAACLRQERLHGPASAPTMDAIFEDAGGLDGVESRVRAHLQRR